MDSNTTTIIAYTGFITSIGTAIIAFINRGRIRSHCCGRTLEADITIDKLPPSPDIQPLPDSPKH